MGAQLKRVIIIRPTLYRKVDEISKNVNDYDKLSVRILSHFMEVATECLGFELLLCGPYTMGFQASSLVCQEISFLGQFIFA